MRKYRNYTDEDIIKISKEVTSIAQLLERLDLRKAGGNYANMKRNLRRLDVDTSHWTGQAWSKDQQKKDWSEYTRAVNLKPHLIRERGHQCEECKNTEWLNFPITLEIHHKNGNRTDNQYDNLLLLCCNCHATTGTWRGRQS